VSQKKLTVGQRTSDFITNTVRSWYFVIFQIAFISFWAIINGVKFNHIYWDPYPFDMLKLILTVEASFVGSMILMSQNRKSELDRRIVFHDYMVNWAAKKEIDQILPIIKADHDKMAEVVDLLKKENRNLDKTDS
jgi:uncharacterized membrane protein